MRDTLIRSLQEISIFRSLSPEYLERLVREFQIKEFKKGEVICSIIRECGEKTESGYYRIRRCTHRELASRIGASREAVTKALKVLSFKGLIKEDRYGYMISPKILGREAE